MSNSFSRSFGDSGLSGQPHTVPGELSKLRSRRVPLRRVEQCGCFPGVLVRSFQRKSDDALFQEPDTWSGVKHEDREVEDVVRPCRYPARWGRMSSLLVVEDRAH